MKKSIRGTLLAVALTAVVWQAVRLIGKKSSPPRIRQEEEPMFVYHGNVRSRVFHAPGCKYYQSKGCQEAFSRRDDALDSGFKPCTLCTP